MLTFVHVGDLKNTPMQINVHTLSSLCYYVCLLYISLISCCVISALINLKRKNVWFSIRI